MTIDFKVHILLSLRTLLYEVLPVTSDLRWFEHVHGGHIVQIQVLLPSRFNARRRHRRFAAVLLIQGDVGTRQEDGDAQE